MARVLITGSTDGLGLMAAQLLADDGHAVTLHARNDQRANDARRVLPAAEHIVVGDLARIEENREVAEQAKALGRYDAVIHNAASDTASHIESQPSMGSSTSSLSTSLPRTC